MWRSSFSENKTVLKKSLYIREGNRYLKKIPNWTSDYVLLKLFSPRGSLILISIHGESHMNTYQGCRNRLRKKSLGCVCVILAIFINFWSCIYLKQKKSLDSRSSHQSCSTGKAVLKKFLNIDRKRTVLESLFNRVAGLKACNFIKRDSDTATQVFPCGYCKIFKNTYS